MSDGLTLLLRQAADRRCAQIQLPAAGEVSKSGRALQRRRLVPLMAAAVLVLASSIGLVAGIHNDRAGQNTTLAPASPAAKVIAPNAQRLLQVLAAAQPPLTATASAAAAGPDDVGPWTAPGRVRAGEALTATTTDARLSVDWTRVLPAVQADEIDGVASRALPGVPQHLVDTGAPQGGDVQSRVYATSDGLLSAYGWSHDGGVASARAGGGGGASELDQARQLEQLVRQVLEP